LNKLYYDEYGGSFYRFKVDDSCFDSQHYI